MDQFNLNDAITLFMRKCNYFDSVEGVFIMNFIINYIDSSPSLYESIKGIRWGLRIVEFSTIIGDVVEISQALQAWYFHRDTFNAGILLGKVAKISSQVYMEGWLE